MENKINITFTFPSIKDSWIGFKTTKRNIGKLQRIINKGDLNLKDVEIVIHKLLNEEEDYKILEAYFAMLN